jgi:hypothetical protein
MPSDSETKSDDHSSHNSGGATSNESSEEEPPRPSYTDRALAVLAARARVLWWVVVSLVTPGRPVDSALPRSHRTGKATRAAVALALVRRRVLEAVERGTRLRVWALLLTAVLMVVTVDSSTGGSRQVRAAAAASRPSWLLERQLQPASTEPLQADDAADEAAVVAKTRRTESNATGLIIRYALFIPDNKEARANKYYKELTASACSVEQHVVPLSHELGLGGVEYWFYVNGPAEEAVRGLMAALGVPESRTVYVRQDSQETRLSLAPWRAMMHELDLNAVNYASSDRLALDVTVLPAHRPRLLLGTDTQFISPPLTMLEVRSR